jgi:VIT1/CCC1 family predicted Fe2+/Mn2+ transporter
MTSPENPVMSQIVIQPEPAHLGGPGEDSNAEKASPAIPNASFSSAASVPPTLKSAIPTHAEITLQEEPIRNEQGKILGISNRSWLRSEGRTGSLGGLFGLGGNDAPPVAAAPQAAALVTLQHSAPSPEPPSEPAEDLPTGKNRLASSASSSSLTLSISSLVSFPNLVIKLTLLESEQYGHSHYSQRAGWLRAMVLGANDGLVSTASLMMGVSGGDSDLQIMVLTGLSGMVAGALSMAAGEYVSVSSQKDSELADLKRERAEFLKGPIHRKAELEELVAIYINRGLRPELARQVAEEIHDKDLEEIVKVHARDELGIDTEDLAKPFQAAWTSAIAFCIGAAIPLLAGSFIKDYVARVITIVVVSSLALVAFGATGAILGGAPLLRASLRVLLGGWLAMGVTFGVGKVCCFEIFFVLWARSHPPSCSL